MTVEQILVNRNIFKCDNSFFEFQFQNSIYQQKRVAMRQVFLNFLYIHHNNGVLSLFGVFLGQSIDALIGRVG